MASPLSAIVLSFTVVARIVARDSLPFFSLTLKMIINNKQEGSAHIYAEPTAD